MLQARSAHLQSTKGQSYKSALEGERGTPTCEHCSGLGREKRPQIWEKRPQILGLCLCSLTESCTRMPGKPAEQWEIAGIDLSTSIFQTA